MRSQHPGHHLHQNSSHGVQHNAHQHIPAGAGASKRLGLVLALTCTFLIVEIIGGIYTNSLALLSDAAHMFTDVTALAIALAAIQLARRPADRKRTFGYHRFEILAAAFNALLLFAVAFYIVYEAWRRLHEVPAIHSNGMLWIALAGLVINLLAMKLLMGGQQDSLNVKGAYLEVMADALGSVGVIMGALLIKLTGWLWVDSVIAVAIGLWVLPRTWVLLRDSINILLEGVPPGLDMNAIEADLAALAHVTGVHDLHVWSLTSGKHSLTAHLVVSTSNWQTVLDAAQNMLLHKYQLGHVTLQCETAICRAAHVHAHQFDSKQPGSADSPEP